MDCGIERHLRPFWRRRFPLLEAARTVRDSSPTSTHSVLAGQRVHSLRCRQPGRLSRYRALGGVFAASGHARVKVTEVRLSELEQDDGTPEGYLFDDVILEEEDLSEPLDLQGDRRLLTQPYDYSIQQLIDELSRGKIRLDIEYQRQYVWDDGKASRLVESLLLNVPIPVCYFAEDDDFNFEVIDGLQRITSLNRYFKNEFALTGVTVLVEVQGKKYSDLAPRDQRRLASRTIRCVAITADSHPDIKFDVFERLNTNVAVLTAQEIRNCVYRGPFNASLKELGKYAPLQDLAGSSGRRRMVGEELVLRFLALHDRLVDYRPPLRQFLNRYMRERLGTPLTPTESELFIGCVGLALDVFGSNAFKVPDRTGTVHNTVNKALFDAVMISIAYSDQGEIRDRKSQMENLVPTLLRDDNFRASLGRATADRKRVFTRIHKVTRALEARGVNTRLPKLVSSEAES